MALVDIEYYNNAYLGEPIEQELFNRYELRAEELVNSLTRGLVDMITSKGEQGFPALTIRAVKKAICAQAEYYSNFGVDIGIGVDDVGFTTGKVSIQSADTKSTNGKYSNAVCGRAVMFLENACLIQRQVELVF